MERFNILSSTAGNQKYSSVGLMVERRFRKRLLLNLGASAYKGKRISPDTPFGFHTGIGTDFILNDDLRAVVFLRQDHIFDRQETRLLSIEIGLHWQAWKKK